MIEITWKKLPRSERATVGAIEFDVWKIGGGARFSALDTTFGVYLGGGQVETIELAKKMVAAFI